MKRCAIFIGMCLGLIATPTHAATWQTESDTVRNKEILDYLHVTEWHEQGILGDGVTIVVADAGVVPKSYVKADGNIFELHPRIIKDPEEVLLSQEHIYMVVRILRMIAPNATIQLSTIHTPTTALDWASKNAQIVTRSLGGAYFNVTVDSSRAAVKNNVFLNISAGNDGTAKRGNITEYARGKEWVVTGAVDWEGDQLLRSYYSSYGRNLKTVSFETVNLCKSVKCKDVEKMRGTSVSTPLVSAMVALYMQAYKQQQGTYPSNSQVRDWMKTNSQDLGAVGYDQYYGDGLFRLPAKTSKQFSDLLVNHKK